MTARPHDALFKSAFETPAAAAVLLRAVLPVEVGDAISWDTLSRDNASFVDAALVDSHGDLLFSARLRASETVSLYLLLEHQSTGDPAMPLRGLAYQVRIWERCRKEQPLAWLPPVIAVVISHAPGGWATSRSLEDLLDPAVRTLPWLAALVPRFSLLIEDLTDLSDVDLQARSLAALQKLALWLLRDARDPVRLLGSFETWISTMVELLSGPGGCESFATLTRYMFRVVDPVHRELLRAKLRLLGPRAEEIAMTIAEQLIEEGRQEGRITTLRRQLAFKFQRETLDPAYEACLQAATPAALDRYAERVLTADSLAAVFAD
jgi:putative YhgA-like transposase